MLRLSDALNFPPRDKKQSEYSVSDKSFKDSTSKTEADVCLKEETGKNHEYMVQFCCG